MKKAFIISVISLLILSAFVLAAGTSTRENEDSENSINCEDKETVRDRIKCRLENKAEVKRYAYEIIEEACKSGDESIKEKCQALYQRSSGCYNEDSSIERKRCFLEKSGININAGGVFRAAPQEAKRNYVILLLYELQERIEKMEENGKITSDEASSLIEKIVEVKKMILAGEPREDIVIKIQELKKEYRTLMASVKERDD